MIEILISGIVGVSVAVCLWSLFLLEKNMSPDLSRRLEKIKQKSNEEASLEKKLEFGISDFKYKIPYLSKFIRKYKLANIIEEKIKMADSKLHTDTFLLMSISCAAPFLIFLATSCKLLALFSIVGLFIPYLKLNFEIEKRYNDFSKQFPDALNMIASSLRAGHPLYSAIGIVSEEMPKPISSVFATVQKDISLGIDIKEAFYSTVKLMPKSIDLRFFITAVLIQKEVGGNLAEVLDKLSDTIRERFKLLGQLKAQTAQTRLSGIVVGFVPVVVMLLVFFMNPEYISPLFNTSDGRLALAGAIVLIIAGFISIHKISQIEM